MPRTADITVSLSIARTDDPIELHILKYLKELQVLNRKFKKHIEDTGRWIHLKDLKTWQAYDFFNYFNFKYKEKYDKPYTLRGNVVKAYLRIEEFISKYGISHADYKEFIDLAFSRYFNFFVIPAIGSICSPSLYNRIMHPNSCGNRVKSRDDLTALDRRIEEENKIFERSIQNQGAIIYGHQRRNWKTSQDARAM